MKFLKFFLFLVFFAMPQSVYSQQNHLDQNLYPAEVNISVKTENHTDSSLGCVNEYEMSINGGGSVKFTGICGKFKGENTFVISVEKVKELLSDFNNVNFFSLDNEYRYKKLPNGNTETVDHVIAMSISLKIGGKSKTVYSFYGAPDGLIAIQKKLNDISREIQKQNDGK